MCKFGEQCLTIFSLSGDKLIFSFVHSYLSGATLIACDAIRGGDHCTFVKLAQGSYFF